VGWAYRKRSRWEVISDFGHKIFDPIDLRKTRNCHQVLMNGGFFFDEIHGDFCDCMCCKYVYMLLQKYSCI
jgi:hypothetical protein